MMFVISDIFHIGIGSIKGYNNSSSWSFLCLSLCFTFLMARLIMYFIMIVYGIIFHTLPWFNKPKSFVQ